MKTEQPDSFAFTPENMTRAKAIIAKYPAGRQASAVIPLLDIAQRQSGNWLPRAAMDHVAEMLEMPRDQGLRSRDLLHDVQHQSGRQKFRAGLHHDAVLAARFGRYCQNLPRTSSASVPAKPPPTANSRSMEVECLGACVNAPMAQINDDFMKI